MNLVGKFLIALTILMSGCVADLDNDFLFADNRHMVTFFNAQIKEYGDNDFALSVLQGIIESLTTYHLPAELALGSFTQTSRGYKTVRNNYGKVINKINDKRERIRQARARNASQGTAQNAEASMTEQQALVARLGGELIRWAGTYYLEDSVLEQLELQYTYQKIFVVEIYLLGLATTRENISRSRQLAAKSIATFNMDRICVCEGIMLAAFFKIRYSYGLGAWKNYDFENSLQGITQMWNDILENHPSKDTIYTFLTDTAVFDKNYIPTTLLSGVKPTEHIYKNLIHPVIQLASAANDLQMNSSNSKSLLQWVKLIWESFPDFGHEHTKHRVEMKLNNAINGLVTRIDAREMGASTSGNPGV